VGSLTEKDPCVFNEIFRVAIVLPHRKLKLSREILKQWRNNLRHYLMMTWPQRRFKDIIDGDLKGDLISCFIITINEKFWEELIVYLPLIRHGPHRKRCAQHPIHHIGLGFSKSPMLQIQQLLGPKPISHLLAPAGSLRASETSSARTVRFTRFLRSHNVRERRHVPEYSTLQADLNKLKPYSYVGRSSTDLISIVTLQAQTVFPPCMRRVQWIPVSEHIVQ
jgi:hypothetical protein